MAKGKSKNGSAANLGFEAKLWAGADALRNRLPAGTAKFTRRAAA